MSNEIISTVTIDLHQQSKHGTSQIVFRCAESDRDVVNRAAHRVGLKTAEFMRLIVIQAARQILDDPKPTKYESSVPAIQLDDEYKIDLDPSLPPGVKI